MLASILSSLTQVSAQWHLMPAPTKGQILRNTSIYLSIYLRSIRVTRPSYMISTPLYRCRQGHCHCFFRLPNHTNPGAVLFRSFSEAVWLLKWAQLLPTFGSSGLTKDSMTNCNHIKVAMFSAFLQQFLRALWLLLSFPQASIVSPWPEVVAVHTNF